MPMPKKVVGDKWSMAGASKEELAPIPEVVSVPVLPDVPLLPEDESLTTEYIDPEEDEFMAAAMPAQKRKGFSFSWLLPLNLFLATVFIATCGYVINLMFLAL